MLPVRSITTTQSILPVRFFFVFIIDCVVVMDLTGSMDSYINKMKIELTKLIQQLSENNPDTPTQIRIRRLQGLLRWKTAHSQRTLWNHDFALQHYRFILIKWRMSKQAFCRSRSLPVEAICPRILSAGSITALKLILANWLT